jgi:hypothetical protein
MLPWQGREDSGACRQLGLKFVTEALVSFVRCKEKEISFMNLTIELPDELAGVYCGATERVCNTVVFE